MKHTSSYLSNGGFKYLDKQTFQNKYELQKALKNFMSNEMKDHEYKYTNS